jgi:hypothetical protein
MMFGWWGFGAVMMVICIILMGRMMMGHGPSSEHGRLSQGESAAPEDRLAERLAAARSTSTSTSGVSKHSEALTGRRTRNATKRKEIAMARSERVAVSGFGQFMASTAGRVSRGAIGIALIVAGVLVGGIAGWVLGALGAVLLAAGLFDFCVITGLVDNIWSGREVRARGRRGAPRTA